MKRFIWLPIVLALLLGIGIGLAIGLFSGSKPAQTAKPEEKPSEPTATPPQNAAYAFYLKDNDLYLARFDGNEPLLLTKNFVEKEHQSLLDIDSLPDEFHSLLSFSKDGSVVVYPEKWYYRAGYGGIIEDSAIPYTGYTLYARFPNEPDRPPIKIGEGLDTYQLSINGDSIVYMGEYANVYRFDFETQKSTFLYQDRSSGFFNIFSPDNRIGYYVDKNRTLMVRQEDFEPEIILEDFGLFENPRLISEDFQTLYYLDNGNLYRKDIGQTAVLLDSNVTDLGANGRRISHCTIDDGNKFYYAKGNELYYYDKTSRLVAEDFSSDLTLYEDGLCVYTAKNETVRYAKNGIPCATPENNLPENAETLQCGDYYFEIWNDDYPYGYGLLETESRSYYAVNTAKDTTTLYCRINNTDTVLCDTVRCGDVIASKNGSVMYRDQDNSLFFHDGNQTRRIDTEVTHFFSLASTY